jgi:glycosyltransferase involved in cell wall biosynthesis
MKRILFYIENNWAFGRIHNDLIKTLYPDVHCDIIDWRIGYSSTDVEYFLKKYDYIITTPHGAMVLDTSYKLPLNKMGAISHSNMDIKHIIFEKKLGAEYFNKFKSYGVISPIVRTMSIAHGVYRIPHILEVGCFTNIHRKNQSKELRSIGYVGAIQKNIDANESVDIKRGRLVEKVAEITGLPLIQQKNLHFLCSEELYCFDLLMFSSLTEGLPTVAIESIASGIPILGTHTGIFPSMAECGAGIILPFEENLFIDKAVDVINDLKLNPEKYQNMCSLALEESKKYDWSVARNSWLKFIESLYS